MKISAPEQHLERDRVAHLNHCVKHAQRQPALIETEISRLPHVRVILGFVAIQQFEIVVETDALVDETHDARQYRMVLEIRIVEQRQRGKPHRCHVTALVMQQTKDLRG